MCVYISNSVFYITLEKKLENAEGKIKKGQSKETKKNEHKNKQVKT